MKEIDVSTWKRKTPYECFSKYSNPVFSMTVRLDVTDLVEFSKRTKTSFFVNFVLIVVLLFYIVFKPLKELSVAFGNVTPLLQRFLLFICLKALCLIYWRNYKTLWYKQEYVFDRQLIDIKNWISYHHSYHEYWILAFVNCCLTKPAADCIKEYNYSPISDINPSYSLTRFISVFETLFIYLNFLGISFRFTNPLATHATGKRYFLPLMNL